MSTRGRELLLLLASLTACVAGLESCFRVASYLRHRSSFERAIADPPELRPGQPVPLGNLLKPSRNPRIVYELRPNLKVDTALGEAIVRVRTNSQGFRDHEYAMAKPPGTYRIVGLGDSMMFGWGVPQGRDYLAIVERRLQRYDAGRQWEVINTAVPGYNTVMELETLKTRGLAYEPDLVIVGYCGNDFDLPNFIWPDEPYTSLRTSFLLRFVNERLRTVRADDGSSPALRGAPALENGAAAFEGDPDRVPPRYRALVGWDAFATALREMRDLGQMQGFRVAVLVFVPGLDGRRPQVVEFVRHLGLGLIDAGAAQDAYMRANGIGTYEGSPLTVSAEDAHPSALSHRLAAGAVLDWMASQGIIGVPEPRIRALSAKEDASSTLRTHAHPAHSD